MALTSESDKPKNDGKKTVEAKKMPEKDPYRTKKSYRQKQDRCKISVVNKRVDAGLKTGGQKEACAKKVIKKKACYKQMRIKYAK